ncbi:MAG: hypothetical protein DSY50_04265, partial [Desulfobulbus sp.]
LEKICDIAGVDEDHAVALKLQAAEVEPPEDIVEDLFAPQEEAAPTDNEPDAEQPPPRVEDESGSAEADGNANAGEEPESEAEVAPSSGENSIDEPGNS